jgi:hypothetical protein
MGLLSALKSRFFPPELCRLAKLGDPATTAESIARTPVVVIGADLGGSIPFDADLNSITTIVEAALQKKPFEGSIHKYEIDGETFLPIFTDRDAAELFCGAYCSLLGRIHAFRLFAILGGYIRSWIADQDIIVVNSQSNNEVKINQSKSQLIRERLPETRTSCDAKFVSIALPMVGVSRPIQFSPDP